MKIAVLGCGAVGSFYGAKLCRAGHELHFLLRSDADRVEAQGVHIRSVDGDFSVRPRIARSAAEIDRADAVLVGLKTTANDVLVDWLPPLIGPQTQVVTLQNGLGSDEFLATLVHPNQVFGGLCFVCLNRIAPGVVHHLAHGRVVLGAFCPGNDAAAAELVSTFQAAAVQCERTPRLAQARWEKLIWNIPFNGLGVAGVVGWDAFLQAEVPPRARWGPCLPTDTLLVNARWARAVRALMEEVIGAANALGFPVRPELADENIRRTQVMGAYRASTLLDFDVGHPLEVASIFLEPQRRARQAGFPTPWLDRLCTVLVELAAPAPTS